jgi:hypothetical protein
MTAEEDSQYNTGVIRMRPTKNAKIGDDLKETKHQKLRFESREREES